MTAPDWMEVSSWGLLLWGIAATVLLVIQLLAWPDDRQKWAATISVFCTGVVVWRIYLVYKFAIPLGGTEQGIVFFLVTALAWGWLAYTSWEMNRGKYWTRIREVCRGRWRR